MVNSVSATWPRRHRCMALCNICFIRLFRIFMRPSEVEAVIRGIAWNFTAVHALLAGRWNKIKLTNFYLLKRIHADTHIKCALGDVSVFNRHIKIWLLVRLLFSRHLLSSVRVDVTNSWLLPISVRYILETRTPINCPSCKSAVHELMICMLSQ